MRRGFRLAIGEESFPQDSEEKYFESDFAIDLIDSVVTDTRGHSGPSQIVCLICPSANRDYNRQSEVLRRS